MFVSLLASIALAVAMVSVPTPARAQSGVDLPQSGVALGDNLPAGYPLEQVGTDHPFYTAVIWINIGDKKYAAYCIEGKVGGRPEGGETGSVKAWDSYRSDRGEDSSLVSGREYSQQRQEKLAWIAYNGYPAKSVKELSELLEIPKLNVADVVAATQAAVSHYSDGFEFNFKSDRRRVKQVYDYLTGPANVGIKAEALQGIGGHPFVNEKQDVILIPRPDEVPATSTTSGPSTTNQVPPTQPTSPTTSTKPSGSTEETTTTTEESTSPAPEVPQEEVRIRTQASFEKDKVVQHAVGKVSDEGWDEVTIENLPPGWYKLHTYQWGTRALEGKQDEELGGNHTVEFIVRNDLEIEAEDDHEGEVFEKSWENPDGTVSGSVVMKLDDSDEIVNLDDGNKIGEFGYISQRLERRDIDEDNEPTGRTDENYATHDGKNFESQKLFPYHGFVPPTMGTSASFVDGKFDNERVDYVEIPEGEEAPAVVYDKVYFTNLAPGIKYSVTGQLMSKSTGKPLGETSSVDFTVDDLITDEEGNDALPDEGSDDTGGYSGWITVAVPREEPLNPGEEAVVFETLHAFAEKKDGGLVSADSKMEIAKHHDLDDEAQTVAVDKEVPRFAPKVRTSASLKNDLFDGERVAKASSATTVYDKVYLDDLVPGVVYTLKGQLVSRSYPYDAFGEEVSTTFTPDKNSENWTENPANGSVSGSVVMEIPWAEQIENGDAVVFERLYFNDLGTEKKLIADHEDPNDAAQIITIDESFKPAPSNPKGKIATKVSVNDVEASKDAPVTVKAEDVADGLNIKDTITYNDLAAGEKYRFEGQLQLVDGEKVTPVGDVVSEDIVAAENGSGTAEVDFKNVEGLKPGATYVVYEKAIPLDDEGNPTTNEAGEPKNSKEDNRKVIKHEDPSDKAQTFVVENPEPSIKTQAEFKDGATEIKAGTVVVDTVTYTNLVAGKTYTLNAKLVDKQDENKVLGTGAVTFNAEGNEGDFVNGEVKVEITVDDDVNTVPAAVAFEYLTSTEVDANGKDNPKGAETDKDSSDDNQIAKHDDITDEAQTVRTVFEPSIKTNAKFQDGSTEVAAGNTVIDTVDYEGLVPGKTYTLSAKLMERLGEAGSYEAGRVLGEGTATFTASETGADSVEVTIKVSDDVTEPVPAAVAFEELTSTEVDENGQDNPQGGNTPETSDDNKIAEHNDINDEAQTVVGEPVPTTTIPLLPSTEQSGGPVPNIQTRAEFKDGVSVVQNGTTVVDTVYYSNLVAGKSYSLDAKLVDKQDANNVLGTGAVTFEVPGTEGELASGNVKVEIAVTNAENPVQAAVAFERLTSKEVNKAGEETDGDTVNDIADHEEISDEAQTVRSVFEPSIATNAKFANGSTEIAVGNTVIDTVDYEGLVPGKEYTLSAQLINKADGKTVVGAGTKTFTPKTTDGSVEVEIKVNDDVTEPVAAAVAFEELTSTVVDKTGQDKPQGGDTPETSDDNKIAEHKDINDDNQTVGVPHITTNANFEKGSSEVTNGSVVVDTVTYAGLVPNKEYTLTAQLIDKADGKTVLGTGTKTFTPKEANGSVDVEITVDNAPDDRVVTAAVAFEELTSTVVDRGGNENPKGGNTPDDYSDDNEIAEHKEINDEDQTVRNPKITTNANFANGAQEVKNGVAVIDTVTYEGLVPGKVYTLTADLINKEDGKTVLGSGNKTFIPTEPNGSEDVTIVVTNAPEGETVTAAVAFEELTSTQVDRAGKDNPKGGDTPKTSDDNEIAEHKDLKDENQTVVSEETPKTSEQPTPETSPATPTSEEPVPTTTIPLLPPTSPETPTTDVCKPVTSTSTVPGTTEPGTTEPGTTVPGTTNPDTTEPGTTVPGTTVPGTTVEETTTEVVTTPEDCGTTESTPTDSEETTTEPTEPTATEPTEPSTTEPATSEKTTEPTKPTKPTSTTPVVPPVVWFPNPQIGTTADFANGAKEVVSGVVVNDTVKYQGLVPGKTYTLTAQLVSKDAFNNLADKNVYGEAVIGTGTKTFTASETGEGSEVVEITVNDGIDTPVRAAVAFETLTSTEVDENGQDNPKGGDTPNDPTDDNPIAEHKNINDQNQTVRSPKTPDTPPVFEEEPYIGTNADFANGSKQVVAGATVVDTVHYAGLVPGKTYTLTADLVTKLNGAVVGQGEKQFTASEDGFGVVNVDITVASWVKEPIYAAVAFERLTSTEVNAQGEELPEGNRVPVEIADHRDINDAAQTVVSPEVDKGRGVTMEPGVSTNADFANGGVVENGATVRDVVNYWGLVPDKTYTATAKLMERVGEKAPYSEGRVLGTETVTFTPKESSGTITVDIPVTNAETPVVAAVAYETITSTEVDRSGKDNPKGGDTPGDYSDDNPIAEHEDINDSFQTVTSEGDTPTTPEETTPAETTSEETTPAETTPAETTTEETTPAETTTEETTPAPVPSETTSTTTTPVPDGGDTPDEGSSVDRDKLWWLLLIPGLGLIPALLGGGGSSTPAPKPAPKPVPSKPAPAPAPSTSTVHTPKPAGKPVPADSPRGEIKQIPSGGTALDADMPAYI